MSVINKDSTLKGLTKEERYQFNKLARFQTITKLEQDILFDLKICEIEGWNCREYIRMIRAMLNKLPH